MTLRLPGWLTLTAALLVLASLSRGGITFAQTAPVSESTSTSAHVSTVTTLVPAEPARLAGVPGARPTATATSQPSQVTASSSTVLDGPMEKGPTWGPVTGREPVPNPHPEAVEYVPSGWPVTLVIPKMGISAHIENVNLELKNNLHAPWKWNEVAWNWIGPRPGEGGHATIFGHLDSYCCPAIFWHLKYLIAGDQLTVVYPHNQSVRFRVMWQHDYANATIPYQWMYSTRGQRGLILATCSGDFHTDGSGYDHKLVVFARMILPNGKLG
jgi:hypothetical protein